MEKNDNKNIFNKVTAIIILSIYVISFAVLIFVAINKNEKLVMAMLFFIIFVTLLIYILKLFSNKKS